MEGPLFRFGVPALTLLCLLASGFLHMVPLVEMAEGETTLDLRWHGYSVLEVAQYNRLLIEEGRALYLGWVRVLDSALPVLGMVTLLIPLRLTRGLLSRMALPALGYCAADLFENQAIAQLLRQGADVLPPDAWVTWASVLTQAKFALLAVSVLLALAALWVHLTKPVAK